MGDVSIEELFGDAGVGADACLSSLLPHSPLSRVGLQETGPIQIHVGVSFYIQGHTQVSSREGFNECKDMASNDKEKFQ